MTQLCPYRIDLTRMECKEGTNLDDLSHDDVYRFNQNGM